MPKINSTEQIVKNCIICNKQINIKIYSNPLNTEYLSPIVAHKKKITCSRNCHKIWQKQILWEDRIGLEKAEQIRKIRSEAARKNNPSKNPDVAKKISNSMKQYCELNPGIRSGENNSFYRKSHTPQRKQKWSENKKGKWAYNLLQKEKQKENSPKRENHPNWLGGISNGDYGLEFNQELKKTVKEAYNFTCQNCLSKELELDIHHIDYDKKNNSLNNLIPLCKKCHGKTNYNRELWKQLFLKN